LTDCTVYIVTVPTPIGRHKQPDLGTLQNASRTGGEVIGRGYLVDLYVRRVSPGAAEDISVPLMEAKSGLKYNCDFYVGHSRSASTRAITATD